MSDELTRFKKFVQRATDVLSKDERVRACWLTGSLAAGKADAQSDVDLRVAVRDQDFASVGDWWPDLIAEIAPVVWQRRWPGPSNEAIIGAISTDYLRFDVVIQSAADTKPRTYEAAQLLFEKDGLADQIELTAPALHNPLAHLAYIVEEYIRLLGMLPIVVGRDDVPMGMEGQFALHSMLIGLLLMENGIDRSASGKRHVAALLNEEQQAILASVPTLEPTMESVIMGRVAYGRLFLPRARRLMEKHGMEYPLEFEEATRQHLWETLGVEL